MIICYVGKLAQKYWNISLILIPKKLILDIPSCQRKCEKASETEKPFVIYLCHNFQDVLKKNKHQYFAIDITRASAVI